MQLLALSGAQESHSFSGLFQYGEHRLLIDAGVRFEVPPGKSPRPDFASLDDTPPSAILLTHAHIDHTGSLPLIVEKFPNIPIFATKGTVALLRILFFEGMRSQDRDQLAMEKESFMFRPQWLREILNRIQTLSFGETFQPIPEATGLTASYARAGHLLGAGMILFESEKGRVLFTGDCSLRPLRTIGSMNLEEVPQADVMICSARYGENIFPPKEKQEEQILEQLESILRNGGRAVFPCFAVGRVQEFILMCQEAQESGRLMKVPIYLDGSVRAASDVFISQKEELDPSFRERLVEGSSPFHNPDQKIFQVQTTVERRRIIRSNGHPSIIFSSSGLLEGGPSPMYIQSIASDRRSALFLSDLQDDEFPGSVVARCKQNDTLQLGNKRASLDCQVIHYNYSMHIDAQEMRELVQAVQPHRLLLVQGDSASLVRLGRQFSNTDVSVPRLGQRLSLSFSKQSLSKDAEQSNGGQKSKEKEAPRDEISADYVPTIKELYESIVTREEVERAWSLGEIAANFYKKSFQVQHRKLLKGLFEFSEPYFIRQRHGSDWMYTPQVKDIVERQHKMLERVKALVPGDIVLVQQISAEQGPPRIAIVQKPFDRGVLSLIAETWKLPKQDWKVIKLIPGIHDDEIDASSLLPDYRRTLDSWRNVVKDEAVDLLSLWKKNIDHARSFSELTAQGYDSFSGKLALGLELLNHGFWLWEWAGESWSPRPEDDLRIEKELLQRHFSLLEAGEARIQLPDGRKGRLTGRMHWDSAEVLWDASTAFAKQDRLSLLEDEVDSGTFEVASPAVKKVAEEPPKEPSANDQAKDESKDSPQEIETSAEANDTPPSKTKLSSTGASNETSSKAKNLSPSALLKLLKDETILRPRKDIRKMDREELLKHFGSKRSGRIVFARLFRSLVWQAYQWIEKGKEEPLNGGMQTFWYRWCLPALKKAPEYRKMKFEPYDLMCRTFTQMVFELGLFSYSDFGFIDLNRRNRLLGAKHPNILIFAEKALWYPMLAELNEKYGVSIIAFYGTPSSLTTEYTARELKALCGEDALHLIGIVSYSPAGEIASRSFLHQLSCTGFPNAAIHSVIHPKYYSADELELFRVPIPSRQKTKLTHWMEKTGGIDGEPYGLESESMPQERLRSLIENQIQNILSGK